MPETPHLPLVRGGSLDHVAVAVRDAGRAARLWRDALGGRFVYGADHPEQGFRFVQYRFPGGGKVELVAPIGEGFLTRFLEERGEGMHHITLRVSAIEQQIRRLREGGIDVVLEDLTDDTWKEAFVHPRDGHGVLVQLAESPYDDDETARHFGGRFSEAILLAPRSM